MADEVYRTRSGPSPVAWLALILAILALIIGWMAYNRAGEDLEDQATEVIEQGVDSAEDAGEAAQEGTDAVEEGLDTGPDGVDDGAQ